MSFQEVTMYRVICDRCETSAQEDSDYYAWADKDQALAEADGWLLNDDGHWCPDCLIVDDEGNHVPNPKPEATP